MNQTDESVAATGLRYDQSLYARCNGNRNIYDNIVRSENRLDNCIGELKIKIHARHGFR